MNVMGNDENATLASNPLEGCPEAENRTHPVIGGLTVLLVRRLDVRAYPGLLEGGCSTP
jgi:hypothetical protein